MKKQYGFQPDYALPPGCTLKEALDERGMSQADLALRTGLAEKTVSQIINGIAPITVETSEKLELATGIPAGFWNRREIAYRESLARAEETQKLALDADWLEEVPVEILAGRGYVERFADEAAQVREVLRFFGASSVEAWRALWAQPLVQFRGLGAQPKKPGYLAAWVRTGEVEVQGIPCQAFSAQQFKETLNDVRALTREAASAWQPKLTSACAAAGVVVVFTQEIPGAHVSGFTRWLTKDKALIQLSLKYKTDDQLWFTFFHEAGHILLHGKRAVFIEDSEGGDSEEEREADLFARDWLIPPSYRTRLPLLKSKATIQSFARELGIAPGIVVGRLQHDGLLDRRFCNDLKVRLRWAGEARLSR